MLIDELGSVSSSEFGSQRPHRRLGHVALLAGEVSGNYGGRRA